MRNPLKLVLGWDETNAHTPLTDEEKANRQTAWQACLRVFIPFYFGFEGLRYRIKKRRAEKVSMDQTPKGSSLSAPGPAQLLALALLFALPSPSATLFRIACGGSGGMDAAGNAWQADASFIGGSPWTNSPNGLVAPYLNLRYSNPPGADFHYVFAVPTGQYVVRLLWIEPNKTAAGQRVFGVEINGAPVVTDLDLFALAGLLKPYERSFLVSAATGAILVNVLPTAGNAVLSGIEISDVPPISPPVVMGARIGDFHVQRIDGQTLSIGAGCSKTSPCNYRIAGILRSFTVGSTITLTAPQPSNGVVLVYIDNQGQLIAESILPITCTAPCSTFQGTGLFPDGSYPIWAWAAVEGAWGVDSGADQRVFLSK